MAIQVDPTLPVARMSLALWHGMIAAGLLEDARVELIDGMMVDMSPNGPQHVKAIQALSELLSAANGSMVMEVRVQMPLTIGESEPQPDLAVVGRGAATADSHPATAALVIEVAFSSHRLDRGRKAELYAEAGVPEYWIVDVPGRRIEVLSGLRDGSYTHTELHGHEASLAPAALPSATVAVGELLPAS